MSTTILPSFLHKYFWGDTISELDVNKNKKYIVQTLLEKGNIDALHWLLSTIDKKTIKDLLSTMRLSKKSTNFWNIYLS